MVVGLLAGLLAHAVLAESGGAPGKIADVDGNEYSSVQIGEQVWLVENLRTTRYQDGTPVLRVENDDSWSRTEEGAYCRPATSGEPLNGPYGLLYNFAAVTHPSKLCPAGWRVPSADDWRELINHLGGDDIAGAKLKAARGGSWSTLPEGTTNESGFTAVPAGGRGRVGGAGEAGRFATWWSSTLEEPMYAWHWGVYPDRHAIRANPGHVNSGFSVRCVQVTPFGE